MKRFINQFFYFFGGLTFLSIIAYLITGGNASFLTMDGVVITDLKKLAVKFLFQVIACLAFAFIVIRNEKEKQKKKEKIGNAKLCDDGNNQTQNK